MTLTHLRGHILNRRPIIKALVQIGGGHHHTRQGCAVVAPESLLCRPIVRVRAILAFVALLRVQKSEADVPALCVLNRLTLGPACRGTPCRTPSTTTLQWRLLSPVPIVPDVHFLGAQPLLLVRYSDGLIMRMRALITILARALDPQPHAEASLALARVVTLASPHLLVNLLRLPT